MKNRNLDHRDDWKTPKSLYDKLDKEFHFNFDPCPEWYPILNEWFGFDGLGIEWGERCFINPPYSRKLKEAFILRAFEESYRNGKTCVMLLPVSTSSKIFHNIIYPNAEIRFLKGRVAFEGVNTFGVSVKKKVGMHDSMIVIFHPPLSSPPLFTPPTN